MKTVKLYPYNKPHTCANCQNQFSGKVCNQCGEKVFSPSQLTVKHFIHQSIDVFTHFENKVLKSVWLTVWKPGLITQHNINGIRVRYAKPVQLFIVVNLLFYLVVSHFQRTDYTPGIYDGRSVQLREYPYLQWAQPFDKAIVTSLDTLRTKKALKAESRLLAEREMKEDWPFRKDTASARMQQYYTSNTFISTYNQKVSFYSKTLIFLLIPIIALLFFAAFYSKLKYYGSALIMATHFLTFNLIVYILFVVLNFGPYKWFGSKTFGALPARAIAAIFYNDTLAPYSTVVLGLYQGYEAFHVIFWTTWLFIAFKRLFNLFWIQNLVISYLFARFFFVLIFSFYKKFLIAFTLWNM